MQKIIKSGNCLGTTRLSEAMTGKRKVNMDLAKRLYQKLSIDSAFILEHS